MIDIVKVLKVEEVGAFVLRIRFSDGMEGDHDFSDLLAEGGQMVEPLKDPAFFRRVFVELGTLTWPNGFGVDTIALHDDMKKSGALRPGAVRQQA